MSPPGTDVLAEFGLAGGTVERLPGGQGMTWWSGGVVLKPVGDPREHTWVCEVYDGWPADAGVSVPTPLRHGDRVSWCQAAPEGHGPLRDLLDSALTAAQPVDVAAQVVHGDLTTNVLWSAAGPAVIDWPPYYRPPGWALAVAAVDALCWEDADPALLDAWADLAQWRDLLLRALAYRLATRLRTETEPARVPESAVLDRLLARA